MRPGQSAAHPRGRAEGTLAEPGEVAERRADAAVGHGIAVGVHGDLRVELGTQWLPQLRGYELMQPRCRYSPSFVSSSRLLTLAKIRSWATSGT